MRGNLVSSATLSLICDLAEGLRSEACKRSSNPNQHWSDNSCPVWSAGVKKPLKLNWRNWTSDQPWSAQPTPSSRINPGRQIEPKQPWPAALATRI
jgi:hypothetical protein